MSRWRLASACSSVFPAPFRPVCPVRCPDPSPVRLEGVPEGHGDAVQLLYVRCVNPSGRLRVQRVRTLPDVRRSLRVSLRESRQVGLPQGVLQWGGLACGVGL